MKKNKKEFTLKYISDELYYNDGVLADKKYSIFSTLDVLNKNSDLFYPTKNMVSSALKMIYTTKELATVLEKTNCTSLEKLANKVEKALRNGKNNDVKINAVVSQVGEFLYKVQNQEQIVGENEYDVASGNKIVDKLASGPANLINQTTKVYGTNRYIDVETKPLELTPLYAKLNNEKNAVAKINEVEQHVKNVYGFNVTYSQAKNPVHLVKKTLKLTKYESGMDSCINMLYSTAKTLVGSRNVGKKLAKQTLAKKNNSEFFNSKVYDNQNVNKIYNEQKDTIKDVVSTLTTIFMARFVFEAPEFAEIERDLTEQACKKMQTLSIGKNSEEDYWINQFIEDRLKVNISQILTANNITNANQLLKIYNKNGTMVLNSEEITNLEDLVFAVQYSGEIFVDNKKLENLLESNSQVKAKVKNKEVKVQKPKPNRYIDNVVRKSEAYKTYYAQYLKEYEEVYKLDFAIENEKIRTRVNEIKSDLDNRLKDLAELSEKSNNEKLLGVYADATAQADALKDVINNSVNGNSARNGYSKYAVLDDFGAEDLDNSPGQVVMTDVYDNIGEQLAMNFEDEKQKKLSSQNRLENLSDEKIKSKVKKYYTDLYYGKNGKTGVIDKYLNYRIIQKSNKKSTTYASDNERLDDKDLNKINKIRDENVNQIVGVMTDVTYDYYNNNKEELKNTTLPVVCNGAVKNLLGIDKDKTFTISDLKKTLAITLADNANQDLKNLNVELYVGKTTYKNMYKKYGNDNEKELN